MFVKHCKVEVYLLELNLCENDNMDNVVTRHFSKADTIGKGGLLYCGPESKLTRELTRYVSYSATSDVSYSATFVCALSRHHREGDAVAI